MTKKNVSFVMSLYSRSGKTAFYPINTIFGDYVMFMYIQQRQLNCILHKGGRGGGEYCP